jgi:hypothetical protein
MSWNSSVTSLNQNNKATLIRKRRLIICWNKAYNFKLKWKYFSTFFLFFIKLHFVLASHYEILIVFFTFLNIKAHSGTLLWARTTRKVLEILPRLLSGFQHFKSMISKDQEKMFETFEILEEMMASDLLKIDLLRIEN